MTDAGHTEPIHLSPSHPRRTRDALAHHIPLPAGLAKAIAEDWAPAPAMPHPAGRDGGESAGAASFARHREALSQAFVGSQLVIPAGQLKVRANDTDYPFRA